MDKWKQKLDGWMMDVWWWIDRWMKGYLPGIHSTEQFLEMFWQIPAVYQQTVEDYSIIITRGSNVCSCNLASEAELGQGNLTLPTKNGTMSQIRTMTYPTQRHLALAADTVAECTGKVSCSRSSWQLIFDRWSYERNVFEWKYLECQTWDKCMLDSWTIIFTSLWCWFI